MKRILSFMLCCMLVLSAVPALAATSDADKGAKYTMATDGVLLQNQEDRNISPADGAMDTNPTIDGVSPTTGLAADTTGRYMPVLVQIVNQHNNKGDRAERFAGLTRYSPWCLQYADIIYEGLLYRTGETRMTAVFNDSFAEGMPVNAGPVRSARMGHVLLAKEWGAALVHAGGPRERTGNNIYELYEEVGMADTGLVIDLTRTNDYNDFKSRVMWNNANDVSACNQNVFLNAVRATIPETNVAPERPFLFNEISPYTDGYEFAYSINLDWGHQYYVSHFYYDEENNVYMRYSGDQPWCTFPTLEDREAGNLDSLINMTFSNVIVQRVPYEWINNSKNNPYMQGVGKGNADIFIGGRYIAGYWVRESIDSPTVYLDDKGNEIQLVPGKTFIADFPTERVLTYQGVQ